MKHPEFTPWPWGLLALVTPLVAVCAALGYYHSPNCDRDLVMAVLLSALGAGNAYVIAIAGGSLRAAALAVPIGALMGFFSVMALQFPPLYLFYLLIVLLGIWGYLIEWLMVVDTNPLSTVFVAGVSGIGALICMGLAAAGFPAASPWAIALAYPFVWSCISASMVVRTRSNGAVEGFFAGFKSSLIGLLRGTVAGGLFYIGMWFVCSALASLLPRAEIVWLFNQPIFFGATTLMACNYYTLKTMFPLLLRVTGAEPVQAKRERKLDRPAETLTDARETIVPAQPTTAEPATR